MSLKLQFDSLSDGGLARRSLSFTWFRFLSGRRWPSSLHNSLQSRAMTGHKSPRMRLSPNRGGGAIWSLQPDQIDRVFHALCKGLKEILEGHQAEMTFLLSQQRETRRNFRMAFLYDLEKEIRAVERYIRRLEFQISKVEELYEMYCIQWRLCQGAINMKTAFSLSPRTRACRESLLELNRNYRHSLQDMSVMEGELEILLGELHIKMKGLIGFARLCPGDQYEVVVRLGRQRWRSTGRIKSDDTQSWDGDDMVFLPHIHHNFEIKVMEVKGLGWLLVGMVTCASADFFVAKPQLVVVDITELGTIKLQLEVSWNPFDSGEKMSYLSVSRQSVSSRKSSGYSKTAASASSFNEKYFISMVHELQDREETLPSPESKSPHNTGDVSLPGYLFNRSNTTVTSNYSPQSPNTFRCSTPDILRKNTEGEPEPESYHTATLGLDTITVQGIRQVSDAQRRAQTIRLGVLIAELEKQLLNQSFSEKELRALDHNVRHLATILKNNLSVLRSSASEETLAVEEVLGSFDFLSNDNTDDDTSCLGSLRLKDSGSFQQSTQRSLGLLSNHSESASEEEVFIVPLTSGNWSLDQTLETHLDICCILLQMIRMTDFSPTRRELLKEMSLQAEVLDRISHLLLEKNNISASDILPKAQRTRDVLMFWEECVRDTSSPFFCYSDHFCRTLKKRYAHKVNAKQPGQTEKVFSRLQQQLQAACQIVPNLRPVCSLERVTLFQLSVYLKRWSIQELGEHISRLSKEEYVLTALRRPKRRQTLNKLRGRFITELLPLDCTLQTLAALQVDSNHKVCEAAANFLCRAASCEVFKSKAVVYYTENLKATDTQTQQVSCLALKCLRAVESVDHIAHMWRPTDEDLRNAVRETVLSFGKKGYLAFQRMEQLCAEMEETMYWNQETEITIL